MSEVVGCGNGAGRGTRTPDPLITNQVHYQLCYAGIEARIVPGRTVQGTFGEPVATLVRKEGATSGAVGTGWAAGVVAGCAEVGHVTTRTPAPAAPPP